MYASSRAVTTLGGLPAAVSVCVLVVNLCCSVSRVAVTTPAQYVVVFCSVNYGRFADCHEQIASLSCVCKHLCLLIFRKRALSLLAVLRKMTCNLRYPSLFLQTSLPAVYESHRISVLRITYKSQSTIVLS